MDMTLTDEQVAFRELAREFLTREALPHVADWDRAESIDTDLIPRMGDLGFFGLDIPEKYGGVGGDFLTYILGIEELGRVDSSLRGIVSVSLGLVGKSIAAYGSEDHKRRWLPGITTGTSIGCFGLTEPDSGSDPSQLKTKAVRVGDHYVLSGSKMFITNGVWADVCLVFARTGDAGPKGISAFLVPTDSPGFSVTEIHGKLGLRGQATAELALNDVRVRTDAMVGEEGSGYRIAMAALDKGRISVASGCVGIVQACLDASVEYASTRSQFGKVIAAHQLVQDMIADISVDLDAARMLVWRAVDLVKRGEPYRTAASKAKYLASEAAVRATNNAIQVLGGYGYLDEYPVSKLLRDARVMTLYEGTSQIQKLLIGRAETGVSAFH